MERTGELDGLDGDTVTIANTQFILVALQGKVGNGDKWAWHNWAHTSVTEPTVGADGSRHAPTAL